MFWREAGARLWFAKDDAFDAAIRRRYEAVHMAAAAGACEDWAGSAEGALALLLLFDQFPRNLYRDTAHAFATDPLAQRIADAAVARGWDREIEAELRPFVYTPFMHAETPELQARSVALHERHAAETGDANSLRFAHMHQDIIGRFGRFPHRNAALGRETTTEERDFLDQGGFKG